MLRFYHLGTHTAVDTTAVFIDVAACGIACYGISANHYVEQQYLPDALVGTKFYEPTEMGYEKKIREHFDKIK